MKFLERDRETLEELVPGLDKKLADTPFELLESRNSPGVELFRDSTAPGLLVPAEHGGVGATPIQALRVQRAIASRSPSLAVGTCMHQFSVASVVTLGEASSGFEWMLMEAVATDHRLIASGFSEGRPGQGILTPSLKAEKAENGWLVSGVKKPCSLARSMDILTASILVDGPDGQPVLGVALIPAESEGISVSPFWNSWVLAGAESEQVTLENVFVHDDLVVTTSLGAGGELDRAMLYSFLWFELLISAGYLGTISALAERVFAAGKASASDRMRLLCEVESAALLLEGMARAQADEAEHEDSLARCLLGRYAVQDSLNRAAGLCIEALGGMAFIQGPEVAYLSAAIHGLPLHPPSRTSTTPAFMDWLQGEKFKLA